MMNSAEMINLSGRGFLGLPQKRHIRHDRTLCRNAVGAQCRFIFEESDVDKESRRVLPSANRVQHFEIR